MRFGKSILAAISALVLVAAPAVAQVAQSKAKPVSSSVERVNTAAKKKNKLGSGSGVVVAVIASAIVIGGIVTAVKNKKDGATSP